VAVNVAVSFDTEALDHRIFFGIVGVALLIGVALPVGVVLLIGVALLVGVALLIGVTELDGLEAGPEPFLLAAVIVNV